MSLQLRAIAHPYARAIFEIARDGHTIDATRKDLAKVDEIIEKSEDFRRFLASPIVTSDEHAAVIQKIAKKLQLGSGVTHLLCLLADKHRLAALPDIIELYGEAADEAEGVLRADAFAPVELSKVQVTRLRAALEEMTGAKIVVNGHVDASLMGGLLVKINDDVYDNTVKTQLTAMRQQVLRI